MVRDAVEKDDVARIARLPSDKDFFELIGALYVVVVQIPRGRRDGRMPQIVAHCDQRCPLRQRMGRMRVA